MVAASSLVNRGLDSWLRETKKNQGPWKSQRCWSLNFRSTLFNSIFLGSLRSLWWNFRFRHALIEPHCQFLAKRATNKQQSLNQLVMFICFWRYKLAVFVKHMHMHQSSLPRSDICFWQMVWNPGAHRFLTYVSDIFSPRWARLALRGLNPCNPQCRILSLNFCRYSVLARPALWINLHACAACVYMEPLTS